MNAAHVRVCIMAGVLTFVIAVPVCYLLALLGVSFRVSSAVSFCIGLYIGYRMAMWWVRQQRSHDDT